MRILCSFPGRAGDLCWALATVRSISETYGFPIDLLITGEFGSLEPLLHQQPYLGHIYADPRWSMADGWQPPSVPIYDPGLFERVIHLGYRRWPELPLPVEIYRTFKEYQTSLQEWASPLDLTRPWITVDHPWPCEVAYGWSDCWFELKYGLMRLLPTNQQSNHQWRACIPAGSRWQTEGFCLPTTWLEAARLIGGAQCFLGDCSALHVLAVAMGTPAIIVEPMEARHNPIFFPLGMDGPQVTVVKGNDSRPSFDARHCADTLRFLWATKS